MKITLRKAEKLHNDLTENLMEAMRMICFDKLANKEIAHLKNEALTCMENTTEKKNGELEGKCSLAEYIAFVEDMISEERILNNLIIQAKAEYCGDRCYATIDRWGNSNKLKERLTNILNMKEQEEQQVNETGYVINKAGEQVSFQYKKNIARTLEYDREFVKQKIRELEEEEDRYLTKKELKELEESIEYEAKYIYSTVSDNLSVFLGRRVML